MSSSNNNPDFFPLVSIVIPVYNGENYLREAIDSALAQTYSNIEVIVVNDGSTDKTEEIALSYKTQIRYYIKENGGQSTALNMGIEKMNGEYFSWLSHDDLYTETKIETQIKKLEEINDPNAIIYSDWDLIDTKRNIIGSGSGKIQNGHIMLDMLMASPINGCTLLIPIKAFNIAGEFNVNRPHTSDVELFFKMSAEATFIHLEDHLVKMRVHPMQATNRKFKYHIKESNLFLIDSLKVISKLNLPPYYEGKDTLYKELAINWSKRGYKDAYLTVLNMLIDNHLFWYFELRTICFGLYLRKNIKSKIKRILYYYDKYRNKYYKE